jgi:hypothetical protein
MEVAVKAMSAAASTVRHTIGVGIEALMIAAIIAALAFGIALANGHPIGATSVLAAGNRYPGTLAATPSTLHAGDYFSVAGCGYDTSLGNVIVAFTGGSWGSPLDANGCFTISDIPALSGDTLPPGVYDVSARQFVHKKWVETGEAVVTVVP